MASIVKRKRNGKTQHVIQWHDAYKGDGRLGIRWVSCRKEGATNDTQRRQLLRRYQAKEDQRRQEVQERGSRPRYATPVAELIELYLEELKEKVEAREERGGRTGLSERTIREYRRALDKLRDHAVDLACGDLDGEVIYRFKHKLTTTKSGGGKILSPHTVNKHLRAVKAFLYRYGDVNPPYFKDLPERLFKKALSTVPAERRLPDVLKPNQLKALLALTLKRDSTRCKITRESKRRGTPKAEMPPKYAPLFPLAVILTLTGARTGEVLQLRWSDVDLDHGTIVFRSKKTGVERVLPLVGDTTGDISPGLLRLLQAWYDRRVDNYVLPHPNSDVPVWPKLPWEELRKEEGLENARAKALRSTWTSYLCSMGRPSTLVAWWAGHSPTVLHKHYADYARLRLKGETLDEAMGLTSLLNEALIC